MNTDELKQKALDYIHLKDLEIGYWWSENDNTIADVLSEFAEHYATSQTEALKKEIEELKEKTEWISVKERLPKEFTSVLVIGNDIRSCALYRDKKFYTDFPLPTNEEITHWMPLPTPPKQ